MIFIILYCAFFNLNIFHIIVLCKYYFQMFIHGIHDHREI